MPCDRSDHVTAMTWSGLPDLWMAGNGRTRRIRRVSAQASIAHHTEFAGKADILARLSRFAGLGQYERAGCEPVRAGLLLPDMITTPKGVGN